jgi:hypothetical protein
VEKRALLPEISERETCPTTVRGTRGLYMKAFPPGGPIPRSQPRAVGTTVTSPDGSFAFYHVAPGRHWVTLVGQGPAVTG